MQFHSLLLFLPAVVDAGLIPPSGLSTGGYAPPTGIVPSGYLGSGAVPTGTAPATVVFPAGTSPPGVQSDGPGHYGHPPGVYHTGAIPTGAYPSGVYPSGYAATGVFPSGYIGTGAPQGTDAPAWDREEGDFGPGHGHGGGHGGGGGFGGPGGGFGGPGGPHGGGPGGPHGPPHGPPGEGGPGGYPHGPPPTVTVTATFTLTPSDLPTGQWTTITATQTVFPNPTGGAAPTGFAVREYSPGQPKMPLESVKEKEGLEEDKPGFWEWVSGLFTH